MKRQERRRHDREQRKQPVLVLGENMLGASLGDLFEAKEGAKLPPKQHGEHRWIAVASFIVPVPGSMIGDEAVAKILGPHNMFALGIGCYDCEEPWREDIGPCRAPAAE